MEVYVVCLSIENYAVDLQVALETISKHRVVDRNVDSRRASLNIITNLILGAAAVCLGFFPINHYLNHNNSENDGSDSVALEESSSEVSSAIICDVP